MQQGRAWVKDFFTRWRRKAKPLGDDRTFYTLLRNFHVETFLVPQHDLDAAVPENDTDARLVELWHHWNECVRGSHIQGRKKIADTARHLKGRPEPHILIAASALLSGDRKMAYEALTRATRLNPKDGPVRLLMSRMGVRRPPVLSFLDRDNPINVTLGKFRARLTS